MSETASVDRLDGLAALVTGGSRGVGRAIAVKLADLGAVVALSYRRDVEAAEAVVEEIRSRGGEAVALQADLRHPGAAGALAERAAAEIGPVAVAVSNAGMASRGLSVEATQREEYLDQFQLHALALTELATAVLPGMREARFGSIVSIGSSVTDALPPNTAPYAMGKLAGQALVRVLALEERSNGVRVNTIAPGLVATDMGARLVRAGANGREISELDSSYPFGRVCRPEDVADAVAFLSRRDSYITGHTLVVDGGGPLTQIY